MSNTQDNSIALIGKTYRNDNGSLSLIIPKELVKNPRDLAYDKIKQIIKQNNGFPILLTEAAAESCDRNESIKYYLLRKEGYSNNNNNNRDKLKLRKNWHLKEVLGLLRNDESIQIIGEKPITIRWKTERENENNGKLTTNSDEERQSELGIEKSNKNDDKGKTSSQKCIEEHSNTISHQCDACDACENNKTNTKEIFPISNNNNDTISKPSNLEDMINDNLNNELNKSIISSIDKPSIYKETGTKEDTENIENKNNNEFQKLTEQSSSHPSHPSHAVEENPSHKEYSGNIQRSSEIIQDDQPQQISKIRLNHSPNADVFTNNTDQKVSEDIEYSSSDNDLSSSYSSS